MLAVGVGADGGRAGRKDGVSSVEGGEGPAREFPAFAQPHIDPTPANCLVLGGRQKALGEGGDGRGSGETRQGGSSAYNAGPGVRETKDRGRSEGGPACA